MHIAVASVHMQCNEHAATQHFAMQLDATLKHRAEGLPGEQRRQRRQELCLPGHADGAVLEQMKQGL